MKQLLVTAAAVGALALAATGSALAEPPACPPTDDACAALAAKLDTLHDDITTLNATMVAQSGEPVSGTVALAAGDAQRLDLIWVGVFLAIGLSAGLWAFRGLRSAVGPVT